MSLRSKLIRLADQNPDIRAAVLPLLTKTAAEPSYEEYVQRKKKENEKPLPKDQWEVRVKGKGKDKDNDKSKSTPKPKKTQSFSVKKSEIPKLQHISKKLPMNWRNDAESMLSTLSKGAPLEVPPPSIKEKLRSVLADTGADSFGIAEQLENMIKSTDTPNLVYSWVINELGSSNEHDVLKSIKSLRKPPTKELAAREYLRTYQRPLLDDIQKRFGKALEREGYEFWWR